MSKMKPFDLTAALEGAPLCTRDGREVQNFRFVGDHPVYMYRATVDLKDGTKVGDFSYTKNGGFCDSSIDDDDLFMVEESDNLQQDWKQGDMIEVRNHTECKWQKRMFVCMKDEKFLCALEGEQKSFANSNFFSGYTWTYARPILKKVVVSRQEIADKFGLELEQLEIVDKK